MGLEIALGNAGEDVGERHARRRLLLHVGGLGEDGAEFLARDLGHLLDTDDEHDAGLPRGNGVDALMDRGRAGGAGVLDPRRRGEAQIAARLQHQRGREVLLHEAGIELAEINGVDVTRLDAGVGQRLGGDVGNHGLDIQILVLRELQVVPADDAGGHGGSPQACRARSIGARLPAI